MKLNNLSMDKVENSVVVIDDDEYRIHSVLKESFVMMTTWNKGRPYVLCGHDIMDEVGDGYPALSLLEVVRQLVEMSSSSECYDIKCIDRIQKDVQSGLTLGMKGLKAGIAKAGCVNEIKQPRGVSKSKKKSK